MGDENSLQGRTQAHKHQAASSTGGFLETGLTGITNLSNGSIVYGDAGEIATELPSGNLNDTLTMGAAVPQWTAPASSATYELVDDQELAGTATFIDSTFAAISGDDVSQLQIVLDLQRSNVGVCNILLQYGIGGLVTSAYYTSYIGTSIASSFYNNQAEWLIAPNPNYRHLMTNAFISLPTSSMTTFNADMVMFSNSANTNPEGFICGGTRDGTGVAGVDQLRVSVSAGNFEQGSKMTTYRLNRT